MQCEFGIIFWSAVRRTLIDIRAQGGNIEHAERFTGLFRKEFIFEGDSKSLRLLAENLQSLSYNTFASQ
jgi:hypothetical protein